MKRTLATILVLILASALVAAPPPQRPGAPPAPNAPHPPGELLPPEGVAELLDLTEAQKTQIQALHEALRATVQPLHEQQRAIHEQLEAAVAAGNAQRIGELVLAERALHTQIEAARTTFETSFAALLTPEQRAKWEVYQEIRELMRPR